MSDQSMELKRDNLLSEDANDQVSSSTLFNSSRLHKLSLFRQADLQDVHRSRTNRWNISTEKPTFTTLSLSEKRENSISSNLDQSSPLEFYRKTRKRIIDPEDSNDSTEVSISPSWPEETTDVDQNQDSGKENKSQTNHLSSLGLKMNDDIGLTRSSELLEHWENSSPKNPEKLEFVPLLKSADRRALRALAKIGQRHSKNTCTNRQKTNPLNYNEHASSRRPFSIFQHPENESSQSGSDELIVSNSKDSEGKIPSFVIQLGSPTESKRIEGQNGDYVRRELSQHFLYGKPPNYKPSTEDSQKPREEFSCNYLVQLGSLMEGKPALQQNSSSIAESTTSSLTYVDHANVIRVGVKSSKHTAQRNISFTLGCLSFVILSTSYHAMKTNMSLAPIANILIQHQVIHVIYQTLLRGSSASFNSTQRRDENQQNIVNTGKLNSIFERISANEVKSSHQTDYFPTYFRKENNEDGMFGTQHQTVKKQSYINNHPPSRANGSRKWCTILHETILKRESCDSYTQVFDNSVQTFKQMVHHLAGEGSQAISMNKKRHEGITNEKEDIWCWNAEMKLFMTTTTLDYYSPSTDLLYRVQNYSSGEKEVLKRLQEDPQLRNQTTSSYTTQRLSLKNDPEGSPVANKTLVAARNGGAVQEITHCPKPPNSIALGSFKLNFDKKQTSFEFKVLKSNGLLHHGPFPKRLTADAECGIADIISCQSVLSSSVESCCISFLTDQDSSIMTNLRYNTIEKSMKIEHNFDIDEEPLMEAFSGFWKSFFGRKRKRLKGIFEELNQ